MADRICNSEKQGIASLMAVAGLVLLGALSGCALAPDIRHRERYHNPLPQLHRIAVLPFFNQSGEPTLNQIQVAEAYYAELQAIPGFEVLPVGVVATGWDQYVLQRGEPMRGEDFQELARFLGVDAVVVGAVTDFTPYSPPRMALTVRWYAANPSFHPVPVGYGLPWGTKAEKEIPRQIVLEAELEVARAQLATQTPPLVSAAPAQTPTPQNPAPQQPLGMEANAVEFASGVVGSGLPEPIEITVDECIPGAPIPSGMMASELPAGWPDPVQLIPEGPNPLGPPAPNPQAGPVLTHTRLYRGDDPDFTEKLADYAYVMDDGRLGGWQGYLTRSDDFIRFCCHLHITEMLEMRGGRDKKDLILRWPISRYQR
jgi:hypothetical protein